MLLFSPIRVLLLIAKLSCAFGDISRVMNRQRFNPFSDRSLCWSTPGLAKYQRDICMKKPDVAKEALLGIKMAYKECQGQFEGHRWNCSSLLTPTGNPYGNAIFQRGYKETAFAYAMSSAGVVISVAKACRQNDLISCSCDSRISPSDKPRGNKNFKWQGCSDNFQYGIKFAKLFLDKRVTGDDLFSHVNLHNNHVGRLVVKNNVETDCKCHGLSGSCTMKTCWKKAPSIGRIGVELKKKYMQAVRIEQSNSGNSNRKRTNKKMRNQKSRRRTIKAKQLMVKGRKKRELLSNLVFFENSPNFCEANPMLDIAGTTGRRCNLISGGPDNCSNLCCGRGYDKTVRKRNVPKCKFNWCCNVTCVDNFIEEEVTVCK